MRATLRITPQTPRLLRECRAAEKLLRREQGKSERVSNNAVIVEALSALRHELAERLRRHGCTWQMVLDEAQAEYSRRTGQPVEDEHHAPRVGWCESSGIVEE